MSTDGLLERAQALADLDRCTEASHVLGTLLKTDPEHLPALCLLAYCRGEQGDSAAMLAAAQSACTVDPTDEWALRLRALALVRLERVDDAIATAREVVRLSPHSWEAYVVLGAALFGLPWRRPAAMRAVRRAIELAPYEADAHFARGTLQHALGLLGPARRSFRRALALNPQHTGAAENLGRIAESRGQLADAVQLYAAATAASPGRVDGATHIRRVLIQLAAWGWFAGIAMMFVLLFAITPLVWILAAAVAGGYAVWATRVVRAFPPNVRPIAASWARTDPQFRARAIGAAVVVVAAVATGVTSSLHPSGDAILVSIGIMLSALFLTGIGIGIVDQRLARRTEDLLYDAGSPDEIGGWSKFVIFRLFRTSCLIGFILWIAAVTSDSWAIRAVLGVLSLASFVAYYRWVMRQPPRAIGAKWERFRLPVPLVSLAILANLLFAVAMAVLPESQRPLLENLAVAPFVLILFAIPAQICWLIVRAVTSVRRIGPHDK